MFLLCGVTICFAIVAWHCFAFHVVYHVKFFKCFRLTCSYVTSFMFLIAATYFVTSVIITSLFISLMICSFILLYFSLYLYSVAFTLWWPVHSFAISLHCDLPWLVTALTSNNTNECNDRSFHTCISHITAVTM